MPASLCSLQGRALDKAAHLAESQFLHLPREDITPTSRGHGEDYTEKLHDSTW